MLASVWKYKTINFFLCTVEWFFLFFPLPIPHMTTATIYRNGNHWKFPWKMNSLETFWRRQIIKIPTFRLTGLFPLYVETGLSVVCQIHLGSNVLYLNFTLLTWLHNTEITTSSPPSSSSSTWKTLPFYSFQPLILTAKPRLPDLLLLSPVLCVFQLSSLKMVIEPFLPVCKVLGSTDLPHQAPWWPCTENKSGFSFL